MKRSARNRTVIFVAVGLAAAGIAAALIAISVVGSSNKKASPVTTTPVPTAPSTVTTATGTTATEAAKVPGATETVKLFGGIPQNLNVLGNPKAPVTMIEFADLQCPFCRDYAVDVLPQIVERYVRTGKVKLVFSGMSFLGPDSETALRATYAAGLQKRLWQFLDLLYRNQGAENSGWVTESLLRSVGASIPGLDVNALMSARSTSNVDDALVASQQQSQSAKVTSTPTFFAGKTGGTLEHMNIGSLTPGAFTPTLDALIK